jgi:hypothetical protein
MRRPVTSRGLGLVAHGVGALLCLGVLALAGPIASAGASATSWLFALSGGSDERHFLVMVGDGAPWDRAVGVLLVGAVVAGCDALVRRGLVRAWVPPLAVLGLASASVALLVVRSEGDGRAAATVGASFGLVVGLAFAVWWCAGLSIARLRNAR